MAQRASAMIALAGGARILLADEPTKGLDAHWRDQTVAMLQAVQRVALTLVLTAQPALLFADEPTSRLDRV